MGSSFKADALNYALGKLESRIEAITDWNYELKNEAGETVKQGLLSDVYREQVGDTVYLVVKVVDTSTDSYTFRRLVAYWRTEDTAKLVAVDHTFGQNYTKQTNQTAIIIVKTGVSGCV